MLNTNYPQVNSQSHVFPTVFYVLPGFFLNVFMSRFFVCCFFIYKNSKGNFFFSGFYYTGCIWRKKDGNENNAYMYCLTDLNTEGFSVCVHEQLMWMCKANN